MDALSIVQYDTIRVRRQTREQLDTLKKSMGYPSYSQLLSSLVETQKARDDMIDQLKKEVSQVTYTFYDILIQMAADIDKPMSEIRLNEVFQLMQKKRMTRSP
ncbi:MAG: hypothetical protein WBE68_06550 [Candidatus Nitrosopolaris sp.]